jgi:hypothetical protein
MAELEDVWILLDHRKKGPMLLVLRWFSSREEAEDYATDMLGLGPLGFQAYHLQNEDRVA